MNEVVTVVDLETTGLDHIKDFVTEVAAIRAEILADGTVREIGRLQTFVTLPAGEEVPKFITDLTRIKASDLAGAPMEWDALTALEAFSFGSTVIAHNAPFDLAFMSRVFEPDRFVCTRALSQIVEPEEKASLKYVCERHGIELNGHHRAINDAAATLQVYAKLRMIADAAGLTYRNTVMDTSERPLTFTPAGAAIITKEAA